MFLSAIKDLCLQFMKSRISYKLCQSKLESIGKKKWLLRSLQQTFKDFAIVDFVHQRHCPTLAGLVRYKETNFQYLPFIVKEIKISQNEAVQQWSVGSQ